MYTLKRSRRRLRTTALSISPSGQIIVIAPIWVPKKNIDEFVASKSDWISKQLSNIKPKRSLKYAHGEMHLYFGEKYPLNFIYTDTNKIKVKFLFNKINIYLKDGNQDVQKALLAWYLDNGKRIITTKVNYFCNQVKAEYNRITLKKVSSIWGSCSHKNNLNFNRKLIMAPHGIVDYVIIHEVCHLIYHNHGQNFWKLVASLDPKFKTHRLWLKQNSHLLSL